MSPENPLTQQEVTPEEYAHIAERLSAREEAIPFMGIEDSVYNKLKAECDAYPEYTTHIDVILERLTREGLKIVIAENGQVYALPYGSDDLVNDSIFPRHLKIADGMDSELKRLVGAGPQRSRKA